MGGSALEKPVGTSLPRVVQTAGRDVLVLKTQCGDGISLLRGSPRISPNTFLSPMRSSD